MAYNMLISWTRKRYVDSGDLHFHLSVSWLIRHEFTKWTCHFRVVLSFVEVSLHAHNIYQSPCCTRSNNLDHLPSSKNLSILQFIFGMKFVFLFSSCKAAVSIIKIQAIISDKHGRWSLRDRSICSPFQNNETIFTKSLGKYNFAPSILYIRNFTEYFTQVIKLVLL